MNADQRKSLVQQLLVNPMFEEIMGTIETREIETCIFAQTDHDRAFAANKVQAIRSFRSDCQSYLDSTPKRRGAPA